jgi:N,N'-diacetylchitobiose transport system permease protein
LSTHLKEAAARPASRAAAPSFRLRRARKRPQQQAMRPWLLLAPSLVVLAVLLLWPLARVALISFQDYGLRQIVSGRTNYIGAANYLEVFRDPLLWRVVLPNTLGLAVAAVAGTVILGTLVALLLTTLNRLWRTVVSSAIMVAWAMPAVTGTYVWVWIFDADSGLVGQLLQGLGILDEPHNWFTDRWSFYAVVLVNVIHHGFPFVAITVLAGLLGVSKEMLEAATVDGAGSIRRFFSITFPTLKPVFAVVVILSTIWDFKVFAQIYLMPGGSGSNRSVFNLGVWSYVESFAQNRYGFGSAVAVLLTVLLLIISVVYVRTLFKEEK